MAVITMTKVRAPSISFCFCLILAFGSHEGVICRQVRRSTIRTPYFQRIHAGIDQPFEQPLSLHEPLHHKYRKQTERLLKLSRNCNSNIPVVLFRLNGKRGGNGGFGDRLLGMVTSYYFALMTKSSFEIKWTQPYKLGDYFIVPSCAGVKNPQQRMKGFGHITDREATFFPISNQVARNAISNWTYFTDYLFLNDIGKSVEISTNSFHWTDIVQHDAFESRAESLGLSTLSQAQLFKLAIDELLGNPTSVLKDSYTTVLRRLAGGLKPNGLPYVGVQIRLGGSNNGPVAGWEDLSRHSLEQVPCFATEAVRLCRRMNIRSIFVTADSEEAVQLFTNTVYREFKSEGSPFPPPIVVHVPGDIAHTDLSYVKHDHAKDVWLKSILDWWVLKHATALVVSRSGFGETAAMASNARAALRLKICPAGKSPSKPENGTRCEFEDLLEREDDILKSLYASWDPMKGCFKQSASVPSILDGNTFL